MFSSCTFFVGFRLFDTPQKGSLFIVLFVLKAAETGTISRLHWDGLHVKVCFSWEGQALLCSRNGERKTQPRIELRLKDGGLSYRLYLVREAPGSWQGGNAWLDFICRETESSLAGSASSNPLPRGPQALW